MAACGSLQHIFEKPLPEAPKSFSPWNQIKPIKPNIDQSSLTEIFGELHFKENSHQPPSSFPILPFSPTSIIDLNPRNSAFKLSRNENDENHSTPKIIRYGSSANCHKKSASFSLNSESLQLCTEGLGFESSDDVENMKNDINEDWRSKEKKTTTTTTTKGKLQGEYRRRRASSLGAFPPPISCIGKSGKPGVCYKSYRQDGRFVLKQVRIPTQEFLHACREDGRLKLLFVQPNYDEFLEDEEADQDEVVEDVEEGICDENIDDEGKENRQA